jgi:hypothetical protein
MPPEPWSALRDIRRRWLYRTLHGVVSGGERAANAGFRGLRRGISHLEARDAPALPSPAETAPLDRAPGEAEH